MCIKTTILYQISWLMQHSSGAVVQCSVKRKYLQSKEHKKLQHSCYGGIHTQDDRAPFSKNKQFQLFNLLLENNSQYLTFKIELHLDCKKFTKPQQLLQENYETMNNEMKFCVLKDLINIYSILPLYIIEEDSWTQMNF